MKPKSQGKAPARASAPSPRRDAARRLARGAGLLALFASAGLLGFLIARLRSAAAPPAAGAALAAPAPPTPPSASFGPRRALEVPEPVGIPADAAARHWVEVNNRARELLEQGDCEEAVRLFDACRQGDPSEDIFRRNLAEALLRCADLKHESGDLEQAILDLARAAELAPERSELATLLARWRNAAELSANDVGSRGSYFCIEHDPEREDLVQHVQEIFNFLEGGGGYKVGAYETLRNVFRVDPVIESRECIRIVLYDHEEFDRLTGLGDWAGGVFDGVIRVAIDDLTSERWRWERVLRHELVHAFVRKVGGSDVPGWLNEGLAQLYEEDQPNLALARAELASHTLFPLEDLRESLATWTDRQAIARAYAQSLVFTAYLRDAVGEDELVAFLESFRDKEPAELLGGLTLADHFSHLAVDLAFER